MCWSWLPWWVVVRLDCSLLRADTLHAPAASPANRKLIQLCSAICGLLAGACCIACASKYPDDPGLAHDDLGIGISLGMSAESAASGQAEVWVITREELNTRSPYTERPPEKDLVVALYYDFVPAASRSSGITAGEINELRCYLATPADSRLKLLGAQAAAMTPEEVVRLCGEPLERTLDIDGTTHLRFLFKPQDDKLARQGDLELVTSHDQAGNCFAFSLALVAPN